jgi:hypothetical protein
METIEDVLATMNWEGISEMEGHASESTDTRNVRNEIKSDLYGKYLCTKILT